MKYVIPILSLIISIIALAVALPRPNNLGIDYLGIIVAIISLATAFAVGFQIWNALSLEARLKELKGKIDADNKAQLEASEKKLKADYDSKVNILSALHGYSSHITSAYMCHNSGSYDQAFILCIKALEYETILKSSNVSYISNLYELIEPYIYSLPVNITDSEKQKYIIRTIAESGNDELIEKIGIIQNRIFTPEHNQD